MTLQERLAAALRNLPPDNEWPMSASSSVYDHLATALLSSPELQPLVALVAAAEAWRDAKIEVDTNPELMLSAHLGTTEAHARMMFYFDAQDDCIRAVDAFRGGAR